MAVEPGWPLAGAGDRRAIAQGPQCIGQIGQPRVGREVGCVCSSATPQRSIVTVEPHNPVGSLRPGSDSADPAQCGDYFSTPVKKPGAPVRAGP